MDGTLGKGDKVEWNTPKGKTTAARAAHRSSALRGT